MGSIRTALRRTILLVALAAGVGALVSWRRASTATPVPSAPPQWPPLPGQPTRPTTLTQETQETQATTAAVLDWLPPLDDGSAPASHPIKVKVSSGIFHVPGGRFYDRAKPERCYSTVAAAEADGYRRSKS